MKNYYQDTKYISNSHLQAFKRCPFFYAEKYINGNVQEIERDYFIYGQIVDTLLTEPEKFNQKFLPVDRRIDISALKETKTDLAELDKEISVKQLEKKPHKSLQDKKEKLMEAIKKMEEAGEKEQITKALYENALESINEISRQELYKMFRVEDMSQEIITLEACGDMPARKGKLDYINVKKKIIADIKTCASFKMFRPQNYYQQLSYYRELASIKYGISEEDWDCYLLVVSKEAEMKHSQMYHISKNLLDIAKQENHELIERFMESQKSGFYTPCTENNTPARQEVCFDCPHYSACPFSQQKEFVYLQ